MYVSFVYKIFDSYLCLSTKLFHKKKTEKKTTLEETDIFLIMKTWNFSELYVT